MLPLVLALAILLVPLAAMAQAPSRIPTVGALSAGPATTPLSALAREAFERGLKELGWLPGQTIRVEAVRALGLTFPPSIQARPNEVIQ